jgi:hypothetical protein
MPQLSTISSVRLGGGRRRHVLIASIDAERANTLDSGTTFSDGERVPVVQQQADARPALSSQAGESPPCSQ